MTDYDEETMLRHVEAASKAAHAGIVRYAKKHGIPSWVLTTNAMCRFAIHVAAHCDERDECQQMLELLLKSYAMGANIAGFGIGISVNGAIVGVNAPSATAGLH